MTTTPAALSEQRLKQLRERLAVEAISHNEMMGECCTEESLNGYQKSLDAANEQIAIIDELLRLRSRPNEGMAEVLEIIRPHVDLGQARLNGSYCVAKIDENTFCGRGRNWPGHRTDAKEWPEHEFIDGGALVAALALPAAVAPGEPTHERIQHVYTRAGRAVVCGIPDDSHNCDQMACSSVEHVLARVPHTVDEKPARDAMTDWRNGENMAVQNKRPSELVDVVTGRPVDPMKRTYGGVTKEQFDAAQAAASSPAPIEQARGEEPYRIIRSKDGQSWAFVFGSEYPTETREDGSRFVTYEAATAAAKMRLAALSAPSLEDARDAARYRWLRESEAARLSVEIDRPEYGENQGRKWWCAFKTPEQLDAAIDEARGKP